jgi:predicted DNA-binding WGR domain protein
MISTITTDQKSTALESVNLICVNPNSNANKFWSAWVLPSGDLYVEYGRQGYSPKPHFYNSPSIDASRNKLRSLIWEKEAKGYVKVELETQPSQVLDFSLLGDRAAEVKTAIEAIQKRWQPLTEFARITFESDRGQFRTELGGITRSLLATAKTSLKQVETTTQQPDRHSQAVADYLRWIPIPVGMKLDPTKLLGKPTQIRQQRQLLTTLEDCLNQIDEIRSLIQSELAGARAEQDDRAFWVNWGSEAAISSETGSSDLRSMGVVWDS